MGNFQFAPGMLECMNGNSVDLLADTIRAALLRNRLDQATHGRIATVAGLSIVEFAGAGYARITLAGKVLALDPTATVNEFYFSSNSLLFPALSPDVLGPAEGLLIFAQKTDDSDSIPLAYHEDGGFPQDPDGTDFTVPPNAEGWLRWGRTASFS